MPYRILLIDDSVDDAFLSQHALTKAGATGEILHLDSGAAAVGYLDGQSPFSNRAEHPLPHVILLDLKMPGMDGLALLEWMKQRPELYQTRIIMLSAVEDWRQINRAYQLGASSFVFKTASEEELQSLARFLNEYGRLPLAVGNPGCEPSAARGKDDLQAGQASSR